jgi:hypothetical protein
MITNIYELRPREDRLSLLEHLVSRFVFRVRVEQAVVGQQICESREHF